MTDTIIRLSDVEFLAKLQEAVNTQGPDFVYARTGAENCYYTPIQGDEAMAADAEDPRRLTGCLVGVFFQVIGIPQEAIDRLHEVDAAGAVARLDSYLSLTYAQTQALGRVQRYQDQGGSWGLAYHEAVEYLTF